MTAISIDKGKTYDVAVIGAGLAGLVASRDLSRSGLSVLVLEARDRVGGRTYIGNALGETLELGGAYVHWTQPNVWYELQRHGLTLQASAPVEKCYWFADSTVHTGTKDKYSDSVHPLLVHLFADARTRFPQPFNLETADAERVEHESIDDRINSLQLNCYERDILESALAGIVHSYKEQGIAQLLHAVGGFFGDYKAFYETAGAWGIQGGTKRLVEAVLSESNASIRLRSPVQAIHDDGLHVRVRIANDQSIVARSIVVAVPLNTLDDMQITPSLPQSAQVMIDRKNPVLALKLWIRVKGEWAFCAYAPAGKHPLNAIRTIRHSDGQTLLMSMCSDASQIPREAGERNALVQEALRKFVADIEVVDSFAYDWVNDPYSKGAWMMHRPGSMTVGAPALRRPHGRIHFAGSDISSLYPGSIEGAMQSGATTARDVVIALRSGLRSKI